MNDYVDQSQILYSWNNSVLKTRILRKNTLTKEKEEKKKIKPEKIYIKIRI